MGDVIPFPEPEDNPNLKGRPKSAKEVKKMLENMGYEVTGEVIDNDLPLKFNIEDVILEVQGPDGEIYEYSIEYDPDED